MENNTSLSRENVVNEEKPVEEPKAEPGLSRREALEVGIAAVKDKEETKAEERATAAPEARVAPEAEVSQALVVEKPTLEPYSRWKQETKDAFKKIPRELQEDSLRVAQSLDETVREVSHKTNEHRDLIDLRNALTPYLKAMGEKMPTEVALKKALKMWGEFENAEDPKLAAAEYLKAKGIDVPEGFLEKKDIQPLQIDPKAIKDEIKAEIFQEQTLARVSQERADASLELETEKNEAGLLRFPQFNGTEAGIQLATKMGQLVVGNHNDSVGFYAYLKARIPESEITQRRILEESYKWFGGTVDDTPGKKAPDKNHLARSNRAATSVPGRGSSNGFSQPPKKLSRREWLAQSIERAKEENH